ncbi:helicase [Diaphorobacter sp. HDW4A]|uniref:helicase n=1 Tax=Diaphorobacter sp. HDW4A TaxID=2714924 RepID=UPI00140B3C6D|nr:helicase [Diaphorobacter sp. HDW4A]QIL79386.1 helicase [Diaphorobacter sp. HDW4A]
MLKFKFLLWILNQLLQRQIKSNPDCARYVAGKELIFQIRTASGVGRCYAIRDSAIRSSSGLTANPEFTLSFNNAAKGFEILSAKDSQAAFLRGLGSKDLTITGDFLEVMWFQGLTAFLQPQKVISPYDRTAF